MSNTAINIKDTEDEELIPTENNKMASIRYAIYKSLQRCKMATNGKIGHIRTSTIDMPLSLKNFEDTFLAKIPRLQENFKRNQITVDEMKLVFGEKWHIFKSEQSSTQARVIGLVSMKYRRKNVILHGSVNCPRYKLIPLKHIFYICIPTFVINTI